MFSLEVEIFEGEMNFDNASGFDTGSEDILLSRLVIPGTKSVQVVKETKKKN
jgi:hypothetical protein